MTNATHALDRRSLLKLISASPLMFGMSGLLAAAQDPKQNPKQDPKSGKPSWFLEALRQARKRQAPVVAFVTPDFRQVEIQTKTLRRPKDAFKHRLSALYNSAANDKDKDNRPRGRCDANAWFTIKFEDRPARMAVYLQLLLDSRNLDMQELLLEAVFVCAPAHLLGAEKAETVVLLDPDGRRTGGAILDISDEHQVIGKLQHLLHSNGKLHKRAKAARTRQIAAALEDLSDTNKKSEKARARLLQDIHAAIPVLVEARHHHKDGAVRRAVGEVIQEAHGRARKQGYRGLLPFGTVLHQRRLYDPCPPCGMAVVPAGSRKMLKLLAK